MAACSIYLVLFIADIDLWLQFFFSDKSFYLLQQDLNLILNILAPVWTLVPMSYKLISIFGSSQLHCRCEMKASFKEMLVVIPIFQVLSVVSGLIFSKNCILEVIYSSQSLILCCTVSVLIPNIEMQEMVLWKIVQFLKQLFIDRKEKYYGKLLDFMEYKH